jgi:hypothetical protein
VELQWLPVTQCHVAKVDHAARGVSVQMLIVAGDR